MEGTFVKFIFVLAVWTTLLLSSEAESPPCYTQPPGLFGYNQSCSNDSECVTGVCSNSTCACNKGTTYNPCAVACVSDCNSTVTAITGTITSPGYPSSSPTYCIWIIQGYTGTTIALNITYMDMSTNSSCAADYIELFDGPSTSSRTFGKVCTTWQPLTLSTTNHMRVVFRSSGKGRFLATFKNKGIPITLSEPQGFISSPGYPLVNTGYMSYNWTIQSHAGTYIILNLTDFRISYFSCDGNFYLNIYDGPIANSSSFLGCLRSTGLIVSTSNYMFIMFKWYYANSDEGFYGFYQTRDSTSSLTATPGTITSPGYALSSNTTYTTWTIRGSIGTFVAFK